MKQSTLQQAIDTSLSSLTCGERDIQAVLRRMRGETVVKRKISVALIFVLLSLALAGAALALSLWMDTGRSVLETEQTSGYFQDWPAQKKMDLARAILEHSALERTPDRAALLAGSLPQEEMERGAEEILAAFTGQEVSEISFMGIMEAAWGPFDHWSHEEQAWYSQLLQEMGLQGEDHTLYVLPTGPLDKDQAIALARREIALGFGVEESELDRYKLTTSFQVPEFASPGDNQPYWHIEYWTPEGMSAEEALFPISFGVFLNPETGAFHEPVPQRIAEMRAYFDGIKARESDPLWQEMRAFETERNLHGNPAAMSLEERALWNQTFRDRVLAKMKEQPELELFGIMTQAAFSYAYGLPDEKAIPQEEAFAIAQRMLVERIGRKEEEVPFFSHRCDVFYDVTDPERPLWKFFFHMPNEYDSDKAFGKALVAYYGKDGERLPNVKVELDAYTGEVLEAFPMDMKDMNTLEDFRKLY